MERFHIFKLGLAILFYAVYCVRPMIVNGQKIDNEINQTKTYTEEDLVFYQGVEGKPGVDFPILSHIPRTSFSCRDVDSGYYADLETDCQVFHICEENKKISFLCPNGTIFQQSELICEWWFKVNCTNSPNLYEESAEQLREDNARRKLSRRVQSHGAVMRTEQRSSVSARQNGRNIESGNKASKRVFVDNRFDNHAPTYRDDLDQNNDLSRSSSSDFRDGSTNTLAPFQKQSQNEEKQQVNRGRGRKPVHFQQPPTVDNEEERKVVPSRTNRRKPIANNATRNYQQQELTSSKPPTNDYSAFGKTERQQDRDFGNDYNHQQNERRKEKSFAIDQNRQDTTNNVQQPVFGSKNRGFTTPAVENKPVSGFNGFEEKTTFGGNNYAIKNAPSTGFTQKTFNQVQGFSTTTETSNFRQTVSFGSQNRVNYNTSPSSVGSGEANKSKITFNAADNYNNQRAGSTSTATLQEENDTNDKTYFNFQQPNKDVIDTRNNGTIPVIPTVLTDKEHKYNIITTTQRSALSGMQNHVFQPVFPSVKQEETFSTTPTKNLNIGAKDGGQKQQSTVPLTKNDIVNRRLESGDSEEAQIPQETASFYKNSFNRIDQDHKSTSPNPYPNHRETYSELKEPRYYSTKIFSAISSVTPQYLTTQPINNGRPFIGSQVGTTLKNVSNSTTSTTAAPAITTGLFNVGKTESSFAFSTESPTTITNEVPTELFNVGRTDKTLRPLALSTLAPFKPQAADDVTAPSQGSFNIGTSTFKPKTESSTGRVIDHATVYGKFVKNSPTTPSSGKIISLSKSLFGGSANSVTPTPFLEFTTPQTKFSSTTPASGNTRILLSKSLFGGNVNGVSPTPFSKVSESKDGEILSAADSYNRGTPQVRFFGKVQTTTKIPGVEVRFNSVNSVTSSFDSYSTTSKPFVSTTGSTRATSPSSNSLGTTLSSELNSVTPSSVNPEFNSVTPSTTDFEITTRRSFGSRTSQPKVSGFFVTKSADPTSPTQKSRIGNIIRPRPFQLPPEPDFRGKAVFTTTESTPTQTPTYPTYKISSASPFAQPSTPQPTTPTPFTAQPTIPSTFENVDSMINALAEMATHNNYSDSPRPGLVIPPSAGPQTLHTLAVYFANALDGIAADKEEEETEDDDEENLTKLELEKKRLTELLTQMTMDRYNELFHEDKDEVHETTTITSRSKGEDDDLEGQHSKGPAQTTPKVRQLAKVFTQALSSYLDDPTTFRKVLEEVRPTEPPEVDTEDNTDLGDDELLNFSDADSKSSYSPFFPTPSPVRPTWGYLIAYNTSQTLDVKNSLNPDLENLQGADSQSFVSQFNKLQNSNKDNREFTTKSPLQLPEDHWTTSPDVNKLFKSAFSFDPASINENFGTTEPTTTTDEAETQETVKEDHHEIKYELRALPQLELNSTQVHGILIDFMNTTKKDEDSKLQRILKKLNTTQDEFLAKMKEIEENPLTRRLILLLINECGNSTQVDARAVPLHSILSHSNSEILETASSVGGFGARQNERKNSNYDIVDPSLSDENQDTRALQLLNSLYTIASRFGK